MTAIPSYRDWSNINIEREYLELIEISPATADAVHHRKISLLEYEIFDRGLTHLYETVDPTWND